MSFCVFCTACADNCRYCTVNGPASATHVITASVLLQQISAKVGHFCIFTLRFIITPDTFTHLYGLLTLLLLSFLSFSVSVGFRGTFSVLQTYLSASRLHCFMQLYFTTKPLRPQGACT